MTFVLSGTDRTLASNGLSRIPIVARCLSTSDAIIRLDLCLLVSVGFHDKTSTFSSHYRRFLHALSRQTERRSLQTGPQSAQGGKDAVELARSARTTQYNKGTGWHTLVRSLVPDWMCK